jgi:hypothetical protein
MKVKTQRPDATRVGDARSKERLPLYNQLIINPDNKEYVG